MNNGIRLSSSDCLEDLSAKYNIFYAIGGGAGALYGLLTGSFGAMLVLGGFGLLIGYTIKASILKSAKYKFRTMEFEMPGVLTKEEIASATAQELQKRDIYVILENDELTFRHGSTEYEFIQEGSTFRLRWTFTVGKAIFGAREIGDYKELRYDTGIIAALGKSLVLCFMII